jgi:adenylate cyclase
VQLPLPDKPSIAVLPFQNMSGDPEQEYFTDGMVEDIITALSRTKALFVIARNSTFSYKGKSPDIRQVGRELGVRYVLEGSVRKAGARVRITGQLIDAQSGAHLWADRFDGALADIFELQDQVTSRVVSAIAPTVEREEIERAQRRPTENLQAYDYYLRGISCFYKATRQANEEGLNLFHKANSLDPGFALSFAFAANSYAQRLGYGWVQDKAGEALEAERLARRALELDQRQPRLLAVIGWVLFYVVERREEGVALLDRAIELDANLFMGWQWRSLASLVLGEKDAISYSEKALQLSSLDPRGSTATMGMALAHFLTGNYEEAAAWAEKAVTQRPRHLVTVLTYMASYAMVGRVEEARAACETYRKLDPDARMSNISERMPIRSDKERERLFEGLRLAGLPE